MFKLLLIYFSQIRSTEKGSADKIAFNGDSM